MFDVIKEAIKIVKGTKEKQETEKEQETEFCPKCKNVGFTIKSKVTENSTTIWNEPCDCGHYLRAYN